MSRFPWDAAMQLGFGVLRLPPKHFWGMTPRELAAAFEAVSGRARRDPPSRSVVDELMERYPMAEDFPDNFRAELSDVSVELGRRGDLADGVSRTLSRAFRGAVLDGRSLNNVLGDIARSFSDIALKAAFKPVGQLVGGAIEQLFTATNPALGGVTPFAKGGVIAAPGYFPMRGGVGLAGEAGPEAIVPLRRGPDGSLGVASAGGGGVNVTMNVRATDARSFLAAEAEVGAMLLRAVRRGTRGS